MKTLKNLLLAALISLPFMARAQVQQTRANLYTEISTNLPTNGANYITAALLRQVVNDITASSYNPLSDGTPVQVNAYSLLGNATGSAATSGSLSSGIILGAPAYADTGIGIQQTGSVAGYFQWIINNTSAAANASADVIVGSNLNTATTNYGDLGMNSSTFTGTGSLALPNAVYVYSQTADLVLATNTANAIHIVTNNGSTDAMTFSSAGAVSFPLLTGNGHLQTTGGNGAVSVDTTSYQPLSTNLTSLAGLSWASTSFVKMTAAGTFGLDTNTYLTTAVTALSGTANQITASASTGSVMLSIPSAFIAPGTLEVTSTSRLDGVTGVGRASSALTQLSVGGTQTSGNSTASLSLNSTLTAEVNGDTLYSEFNSPTFATGVITGINTFVYHTSTPTLSGTGTITNAVGLDLSNWSLGAGPAVITSQMGLVVRSQTVGLGNADIIFGGATYPTSTNEGLWQEDTYPNLFGGIVEHANGTASAPSIVYSGATTTGLYWSNPGIGFAVAGAGVGSWIAAGLNVVGNETIGGAAAGAATTSTNIIKTVGSIANNTATTVLTITVPNAAHSATVHVRLTGSLGAGGAIGANEASGCISYDVVVTRTAGVNMVASIATATGSATALVSGGATITITAALASVSGAVGATNTVAVQATIARGSGSSTNHTCLVEATVDNANASGITLS